MTSASSAASIYQKRKTTADLNDNKFAAQLNEFQTSKNSTTLIQKAQMDQQLMQRHNQLRLPQERLEQARKEKAAVLPTDNRFGAFARTTSAPAPAPAPAPAESTLPTKQNGRPSPEQMLAYQREQRQAIQQQQQEQRAARENRYELFYCKSLPQSLQRAELIVQGLLRYFTDAFIRQNVLAINFDDESNIGRVHETILKTEKYLRIIQSDCILYDKFEGYIILPEYNILKILKSYCQSVAPKQETPPEEKRVQVDRARQQALQEQERYEAQARLNAEENARKLIPFAGASQNTVLAMNRKPITDYEESLSYSSQKATGFSSLAKQVGADLSSPTSDVKLKHVVPSSTNSLMTAATLQDVEALPSSNISLIYGQNKGCTLGYGNDMDRINQDFVDAHNAANATERDISSQMSGGKTRKNPGESVKMLATPSTTRASTTRVSQQQTGPNLQHLQGLERTPSLDQTLMTGSDGGQLGTLRQLKVSKEKKQAAAAVSN